MPPYFDRSQLHAAMSARALPALERLAANPNSLARSRNHRFGNDDPPPYMSSSESEGEEALSHPVLARSRETVLEEFRDVLREPLSDAELDDVASYANSLCLYDPGERFGDEARLEEERLSTFCRRQNPNSHAKEFLQWPRGQHTRAVIARRNIRKRWQRLGLWNSEWGIPGRVNKRPNDAVRSWKWKWQSDADAPPLDPRHPISRAARLRKGLLNGESVPPPPRTHLQNGVSASEAESFIISRPWFVFAIEHLEFRTRMLRIPMQQWGTVNTEDDSQVTKWWKQRGDWEDDWEVPGDRHRPVAGWKWRHESPSPEPEDLAFLNTDDMDLTPSEADALEAIPPATPPRPNNFQPHLVEENYNLDPSDLFYMVRPSNPAPEQDGSDQVDEQEEWPVEKEQADHTQPPRRRGRPRKAQAIGAPRSVQQPVEAPPVRRRSARIAAMHASPPPPAATRATRARAGKGAVSVADAPKKRGRPRTTRDGVSKPTAAPTKRGRKPGSAKTAAVAAAAAAAVGGEAEKGAPEAGKRGRGRPRRT
ncbi:hypothetical protein BT67DRAFT_444022 [Trichocladium antarcticum]|uniref:Uncharacterized protein n=1 Tax=Trichocladium antarcticum TaxID=1450529 RepID=A0AAN6ZBS5_9PEZI|nr:hypothetical protein BT67DRAFT_444022 [Trichocladium antarcticum]